jgi:2-phosphosulfolactate phosphatase
MSKVKQNVEVCFSPALYEIFHNPQAIVVVTDILRASSAICTAFMNGANQIIPVGTIDEAKKYKDLGYLVAAERDGIKIDFADFGNSPFNFTRERISGKNVVYSTTNGTQAIQLACKANKVVIGSFLNISALADWIDSEKRQTIILCSGWKDRFSLEDTVFAGALVQKLIDAGGFETICDSGVAACDLWSLAKNNLIGYIQKAAQKNRLEKLGLDDVIEFCHTPDQTDVIPILKDNFLVKLK